MNNLLLIDDHQVIRMGVRNALSDLFRSSDIYEAQDEDSAVLQLKARPYKLIISDIKMPGSQPFGLAEYMVSNYPQARLLIFSMNEEQLYAKRFLQLGAMGFVSKNSDLSELRKAVEMALSGRKYISENMSGHLIDSLKQKNAGNPFEMLSKREFEICILLVSGQSIARIAGTLSVAQSTVGTQKARIFEKLGVENLAELIELAKLNGI